MAYFGSRRFTLLALSSGLLLFYWYVFFIYHVEADEQPEPARKILKNQYQIMEKRLYNIITTPGMVVTVVMAIGLLTTEVLKDSWLHIKLLLSLF